MEALNTDRILAHEPKKYLEQFNLDLGGRIANFLQFYDLRINEVDLALLDSWDQPPKLVNSCLSLEYFSTIPDHLREQHARLHTDLSNDIQRQDYS